MIIARRANVPVGSLSKYKAVVKNPSRNEAKSENARYLWGKPIGSMVNANVVKAVAVTMNA
jgi:hypothetical protein